MKVFDLRGTCIRSLAGHTNAVATLQISDQHGRSQSLITGSWDGTVRLNDLRSSAPVSQSLIAHRGAVYTLQQRGTRLLTGGSDGCVNVWDLRRMQRMQSFHAHNYAVDCLQFDERKIVTGSRDALLRVWWFDRSG